MRGSRLCGGPHSQLHRDGILRGNTRLMLRCDQIIESLDGGGTKRRGRPGAPVRSLLFLSASEKLEPPRPRLCFSYSVELICSPGTPLENNRRASVTLPKSTPTQAGIVRLQATAWWSWSDSNRPPKCYGTWFESDQTTLVGHLSRSSGVCCFV